MPNLKLKDPEFKNRVRQRIAQRRDRGAVAVTILPPTAIMPPSAPIKTDDGAEVALLKVLKKRGRPKKTAVLDVGHNTDETRQVPADVQRETGQDHVVTHMEGASLAPLISYLRKEWLLRQDMVRARVRLINQTKAILRGIIFAHDPELGKAHRDAFRTDEANPDSKTSRKVTAAVEGLYKACRGEGSHPLAPEGIAAVGVFLEAIELFEKKQASHERTISKRAKELPVAKWVDDVWGFSLIRLAMIVGEAGDLSDYANPGKLWKRFGRAVFDGQAQRRMKLTESQLNELRETGVNPMGYNPQRSSELYNLGVSIIGGMGRGYRPVVGEDLAANTDLGPYQKLFVERLRYLAERDPAEYARDPVEKDGVMRESFSKHAWASARRYVEKRLLRDLWREWRGATTTTMLSVSSETPLSE